MPKLKLPADNLELDLPEGANFREAVQNGGGTILFGCEQGVCGTCLVTVEEGMENIADKTEQEEQTLQVFSAEDNQRLTCQCNMKGPGDVTIRPAR